MDYSGFLLLVEIFGAYGRTGPGIEGTLRCPWRINNDAVDIEEDADAVDTGKAIMTYLEWVHCLQN